METDVVPVVLFRPNINSSLSESYIHSMRMEEGTLMIGVSSSKQSIGIGIWSCFARSVAAPTRNTDTVIRNLMYFIFLYKLVIAKIRVTCQKMKIREQRKPNGLIVVNCSLSMCYMIVDAKKPNWRHLSPIKNGQKVL